MIDRTGMSSGKLQRLRALSRARSAKEKASITISSSLLAVVDALAGTSRRSAWIEEAVRRQVRRELRFARRQSELARLDAHADQLNAEGAASAAFQVRWDEE